ncbi:MAG: GGDEF domain-containing response regulator [Vicinamibacterales bacterium]
MTWPTDRTPAPLFNAETDGARTLSDGGAHMPRGGEQELPANSTPGKGHQTCVGPVMRAVIADDDPVTTAVLTRSLQRLGIEVTAASDGSDAWRLLTSTPPPELAILDWMMPGIDGIELCRRIRQEPALSGMYVLLLTGRDARSDLVAGLDAGADDYMIKPIDTEELRARLQVGIRVARLQSRLADQVSELQEARDHLTRLVSTDVLTELHSRRSWFELGGTEFSRFARYDRSFSVLLMDLDFFKRVNDTYGHDVGDLLLRRFADMLRAECRHSDIVGRLGGEEFALLAPETSIEEAQSLAERICEECRRLVITVPAGAVRFSCSIGISQSVVDDDGIERVLQRADTALYEAKRRGRDCWQIAVTTPHLGLQYDHPTPVRAEIAKRSIAV